MAAGIAAVLTGVDPLQIEPNLRDRAGLRGRHAIVRSLADQLRAARQASPRLPLASAKRRVGSRAAEIAAKPRRNWRQIREGVFVDKLAYRGSPSTSIRSTFSG